MNDVYIYVSDDDAAREAFVYKCVKEINKFSTCSFWQRTWTMVDSKVYGEDAPVFLDLHNPKKAMAIVLDTPNFKKHQVDHLL